MQINYANSIVLVTGVSCSLIGLGEDSDQLWNAQARNDWRRCPRRRTSAGVVDVVHQQILAKITDARLGRGCSDVVVDARHTNAKFAAFFLLLKIQPVHVYYSTYFLRRTDSNFALFLLLLLLLLLLLQHATIWR